MNCTGKMVRIAHGRLGILSMVKLKKKCLSRGSFRTHGRVIGNKNFFIFGLIGELIVYPCSASVFVHNSTILFPETPWPIKAKFYVEPLWVGGMKVCSRHLGCI